MDENESYPWYGLPFYRSLSEQILMFGAPKGILILNGLLGFLFIVDFNFFWIIPVNILLHFGCIYLAKNDDQFFDCLREYIHKKNYYCT
ncbi:MAG: VirB3 family type IV secretion system protein [Proteocatella sp.]